jgi:hypothetical protein
MRGSEVRILSAAPLSPAEHCPPTRHAWVGGSNPLRGTIIASRALSTHSSCVGGGSNPLRGTIIASRALSTHSSCVGRRFESSPRHHYRQQSTVHPLVMRGSEVRILSAAPLSPAEHCRPTRHAWVEVRILSAAPLSPAEHCPPTRHAWVGGSNPLRGTIIASRALSTHMRWVEVRILSAAPVFPNHRQ